MRTDMFGGRRIAVAILILVAGLAKAATFDVNYVAPAAGVTLTVSAPEPTSTPFLVTIIKDGKPLTAAVLGTGLYRYKAIIADGRSHPEIASNPKAKAFPSEVDLLVAAGERTIFIVHSFAEVVSGNVLGEYTTATCSTPFAFVTRDGHRYKATYTRTVEACTLRVTERALEPADALEVPLTNLLVKP